MAPASTASATCAAYAKQCCVGECKKSNGGFVRVLPDRVPRSEQHLLPDQPLVDHEAKVSPEPELTDAARLTNGHLSDYYLFRARCASSAAIPSSRLERPNPSLRQSAGVSPKSEK